MIYLSYFSSKQKDRLIIFSSSLIANHNLNHKRVKIMALNSVHKRNISRNLLFLAIRFDSGDQLEDGIVDIELLSKK